VPPPYSFFEAEPNLLRSWGADTPSLATIKLTASFVDTRLLAVEFFIQRPSRNKGFNRDQGVRKISPQDP
jgi:hypothetical protein